MKLVAVEIELGDRVLHEELQIGSVFSAMPHVHRYIYKMMPIWKQQFGAGVVLTRVTVGPMREDNTSAPS